jgi:CDP-glucose 4,6-dehydratase
VWPLEQTLAATAAWYRAWQESGNILSREQLAAYVADARAAGLTWSGG